MDTNSSLTILNEKYLEENPKSVIVPDIGQPPIDMNYRCAINAIEDKLKEKETTVYTDFFPLRHSFAEGTYMRELFIPKGYIVTGKIHRVSYISFFLQGDVTMYTEAGVKRFQAPLTVVSPAWTKRMSYSHSDMIWVTVHPNPTNSRDIQELEDIIHVEKFEDVVDNNNADIDKVMNDFIEHIKKEELCQESH